MGFNPSRSRRRSAGLDPAGTPSRRLTTSAAITAHWPTPATPHDCIALSAALRSMLECNVDVWAHGFDPDQAAARLVARLVAIGAESEWPPPPPRQPHRSLTRTRHRTCSGLVPRLDEITLRYTRLDTRRWTWNGRSTRTWTARRRADLVLDATEHLAAIGSNTRS